MRQNTETVSASAVQRHRGLTADWSSRIPIVFWPLLVTVIAQSHILGNSFLFDDFVHLYRVANFPFLQAISMQWGGHLLHSFTTVVWVVKSLFGLNSFVFLLLGLMVHSVSVWLLFQIISRLTGRAMVAAFGATLWGTSPISVGTLGWISVHGQAYATLAFLWVLLDIVRYSQVPGLLSNGLLLRHTCLLLVAATSFGTGLTSTLVLPLVVALWNPLPTHRFRLIGVYGAVAVVAVVLYVMTMRQHGDKPDNLGNQFDILRQSLVNIPVISRAYAALLAIGSSGLLWGPLLVGKTAVVPKGSLTFVVNTATVFVTLPLLIWGYRVSEPLERRRFFALLLIPCAVYGLIAIARGATYFVNIPGTVRYHYLPPAIIVVVFCLVFSKLVDRLPARALGYGRIAYFSWLVLLIIPLALTPVIARRETLFKPQNQQLRQAQRELETALTSHAGQRVIYIPNKPFSIIPWEDMREEFPGLAGVFVITYPSNIVDGTRVVFLEESKEIVQSAQKQAGSRMSELLIATPKEEK